MRYIHANETAAAPFAAIRAGRDAHNRDALAPVGMCDERSSRPELRPLGRGESE